MRIAVKNIQKTRLPARVLAHVKNTGPYKGNTALFEKLFGTVMQWAMMKNLLDSSSSEAITIYHDDPESVPEEKQRISVGFTVPRGTLGEGEIEILEVPESDFVVGSFEILPHEYENAWNEVMEFMMENQITPGELCYESYRNDPHEHPEGKHIVDICVSV